jgi:hypothetical protein
MSNKTKYDEQIAHLIAHPEDIRAQWIAGKGIFGMIDSIGVRTNNRNVGCLTLIKNNHSFYAYTAGKVNKELTNRIRSDELLPRCFEDITPENLLVFKEYWLEIDELNKL